MCSKAEGRLVQDSGFRVQGLGFWIQGSGLTDHLLRQIAATDIAVGGICLESRQLQRQIAQADIVAAVERIWHI